MGLSTSFFASFQTILQVAAKIVLKCRSDDIFHLLKNQRPRCFILNYSHLSELQVSQVAVIVVKNLPANSGDMGSIPGSGRSPGEENGNPLHYSCLENSMDRGAWQATVHEVTKLDTTELISTI